MRAIDIHAHIFSRVNGANNFGPVVSQRYGRVLNGGEVKPFMPPLSTDTSFSADALLELMSRSDVEKAVLMQNPTIGIINGEIAAAVAAHPGVFAGVVQVDPFLPGAADTLEAELKKGSFCALKLEMSSDWGWLSIHPRTDFSFTELYPILDVVREHKLKVIFDTGAAVGRYYLPIEYRKLAEQYPDVRFIIEHQGYYTGNGGFERHIELLGLGKLPNVSFGISAAGQVLSEPYPCPEAMTMLHRAAELMGTEKLMWGSDCPTTLNRYTYQQMKELVELHTPFFTEREREQVLYGNARELFFS
ncbi:MAG: amidohydrolase family protein [Oscillospiraceae bacterium]